MFIGIYLIMVNDPQILFNDGFYPLLHVVMPEGSLLRPRFPSALGCRTHALARLFDVLGGALCKSAPELNTASGYGTSPYMLYSGWDGAGRVLLLDGDPLRRHPGPADRRRHGRPLVVAALREHPDRVPRGLLPDADRRVHDGHRLRRPRLPPGRQRRREALRLSRAGRGLDPRRPLADPAVGRARRLARGRSVEDPRARRRHRGESCRRNATTSRSRRATCSSTARPAGAAGRTGSTGRSEAVARDVSFGLVSREFAKEGYGVVLADDGAADAAATEAERARQREERGDALAFDFGPPLDEILATCEAETGIAPPEPGDAAPLVAARAGRRGARARARRRRDPGAGRMTTQFEGFHGRPASAGAPPCS